MPQAILMSPRWGLPGSYTGYINLAPLELFGSPGSYTGYINLAPLGLFGSPGALPPGHINLAPLGLFGSYLSYERFLKKSLFPS